MKLIHLPLIVLILPTALAQSPSKAIITNLDSAAWTHDKGDPPGEEPVMLHADPATGGMDLLVRLPGGHIIAPHFHDSNERIIVIEGQLTLHRDTGDTAVNPGGSAFLPAREVQHLACTAKSRCTFYLSWDGKPASHAAK
jgi:quercetin dioxygenase-like cupin family protein